MYCKFQGWFEKCTKATEKNCNMLKRQYLLILLFDSISFTLLFFFYNESRVHRIGAEVRGGSSGTDLEKKVGFCSLMKMKNVEENCGRPFLLLFEMID